MTTAAACRNVEQHTPQPTGYVQWFEWAAEMAATHRQKRCAGCGRFAVWVPLTTEEQETNQP